MAFFDGGDDVGAAEPVGLGEVGGGPLRGVVGVGVVEADDVEAAVAGLALGGDELFGCDVVTVVRGVGAGVAGADDLADLVDGGRAGVLLGKNNGVEGNTVHQIVRAGNTRTDSAHNRYNIAPQELVKIQRQARNLGLDIVGFYHSHPDHPPQWSPTDFAEAHWLGCSYVITAVEKGKAAITNSFLLLGTTEDDKTFHDEAIEIQIAEASLTQKGQA